MWWRSKRIGVLLCAAFAESDPDAFVILGQVVDDLVLLSRNQEWSQYGLHRLSFHGFGEAFVHAELLQSLFHVSEVLRIRAISPEEDWSIWLAAEVKDLQARLRYLGITISVVHDRLAKVVDEPDASSAASAFAEAYEWVAGALRRKRPREV